MVIRTTFILTLFCIDLWQPQNNKQNKEALYTVSNSTNTALNYDGNVNRLHLWFLTTYSSRPGMQLSMEYGKDNSREFMPTRALLDFYDESKDARYYGSFQEVWICNKAYTWTAADVASYKKDPSLIGKQMIPGKDRIHQYNKDITQVQPFHMLRPIPQEEINALTNGTEFGQNEGYN